MIRAVRAMLIAAVFSVLLVATGPLWSQEASLTQLQLADAAELVNPIYWLAPEIATHSGSPLLLELTFPDPDGRLTTVTVESGVSSVSYQIAARREGQTVRLTLSPFLTPGVFDLEIGQRLRVGEETEVVVSSARIGFIDFVFGRDNLRFGNNADYESVVGTFGEILGEWLDKRFDGVDEVALVPMVDYMYGFFGKRGGRCYAFAGSEARFWKWPELLPTYFDETYDFRVTARQTQRDMHFLQFDMAFDHFLTGTYDLSVEPTENRDGERREAILEQVMLAVSHVDSGVPAVVGLIGTQFHHAMLVYGYVHRPEMGIMDLLVANNWKSEEDLNLQSRDAEAVRVYLGEGHSGAMIEWRHAGGIRDHEIDRLFVVDVKQEYEHDRRHLDNLVAARVGQLTETRRGLFVIEGANGAWLTDGESVTGYESRRTKEELEDVRFDKVDRTYRFEYPVDRDLWLELDDDLGARILYFFPGEEPGSATAWIEETPAPEDGEAVRRRVTRETSPPHWVSVVETEE